MSFFTAPSARVGECPSSSKIKRNFRPFTPPAALISLTAIVRPSRPPNPMYAAGPVIGPKPPIRISSFVTPWAEAVLAKSIAAILASPSPTNFLIMFVSDCCLQIFCNIFFVSRSYRGLRPLTRDIYLRLTLEQRFFASSRCANIHDSY